MPAITLEIAKENFNMWLEAEQALALAQSYNDGKMSLTRANLADVVKQRKYWQGIVEKLERGAKGKRRVIRAIPRDL